MKQLLREVKYPRDDVADVLSQLAVLTTRVDVLDSDSAGHGRQLDDLRSNLSTADAGSRGRDESLHRKVDAHARQFEHSLSRLTDNQEVIAGLKAFLRMVRANA